MTMPPSPMTALAQGAAAQHELFQAYVTAGFSRPEAMQIMLLIMWYGMIKNDS
jgi:hypothetical protein